MAFEASPVRIEFAGRVVSSRNQEESPSVHNFGDLLAHEDNSIFMGGRRVSGMRRGRYSYSEHFNAAKKFARFAINILKLFILVIIYIVVTQIDVKQQIDIRRRGWTLKVLRFYNYTFFLAICLGLALRVSKN